MLPGFIVQLPDGRPLKSTLPVAAPQVGWIMVPTVGADGADGSLRLTVVPTVFDVQPAPVVTLKLLYDPAARPLMVITPPALLVKEADWALPLL